VFFQTKIRALAAILLCLSSPALAGGWTQPEGTHYLKVWDRTMIGSRVFPAGGGIEDLPDSYQDHALNIYFEYGLTDSWTLIAQMQPLGFAQFADESTAYVGDSVIGLRRALTTDDVRLAFEARVGHAPGWGERVIGSGLVAEEPFFYQPTVRTERVDAELQVGTGFDGGWLSASAGARWYSRGGLDPALIATGQVGLLFDDVTASLYASAHQPFGDVTVTNISGAGQTRFIGFGSDISCWIDETWAVTFGFGGALAVESNAATPSLTLGFEHR
jgi:hypothetical protein